MSIEIDDSNQAFLAIEHNDHLLSARNNRRILPG